MRCALSKVVGGLALSAALAGGYPVGAQVFEPTSEAASGSTDRRPVIVVPGVTGSELLGPRQQASLGRAARNLVWPRDGGLSPGAADRRWRRCSPARCGDRGDPARESLPERRPTDRSSRRSRPTVTVGVTSRVRAPTTPFSCSPTTGVRTTSRPWHACGPPSGACARGARCVAPGARPHLSERRRAPLSVPDQVRGAASLEEAERGMAVDGDGFRVAHLILVGSSNGGSLRILREMLRGRSYIPWIGRRWQPEVLFTFPVALSGSARPGRYAHRRSFGVSGWTPTCTIHRPGDRRATGGRPSIGAGSAR